MLKVPRKLHKVRVSFVPLNYLGNKGKFYFLREASHESVVFASSNFIYEGSLSSSGSFCLAGTALGAPSNGSAEVGERLITLGAASVCVAGAAFGTPPARFAWQVQHLEPLGSKGCP